MFSIIGNAEIWDRRIDQFTGNVHRPLQNGGIVLDS
jgi:hypothetical protein